MLPSAGPGGGDPPWTPPPRAAPLLSLGGAGQGRAGTSPLPGRGQTKYHWGKREPSPVGLDCITLCRYCVRLSIEYMWIPRSKDERRELSTLAEDEDGDRETEG
jgi:hypothetical protein